MTLLLLGLCVMRQLHDREHVAEQKAHLMVDRKQEKKGREEAGTRYTVHRHTLDDLLPPAISHSL